MNYIIVIDITQLQFDMNDIYRFITTSPKVDDWWHYLPSIYIVTTEMSAKEMADSFVTNYPGLRHFITKVDLSEYNGVLKNSAWDWLKKKTQKIFNINPIPRPRPVSIEDLLRRATETSIKKREDPLNPLLEAILGKASK